MTHEYRSATLLCGHEEDGERREILGEVGELDPTFVETSVSSEWDGRPRRVGWLDLDLGVLLDPQRATRRPLESAPVSRFPSSDIDLAFMVPDEVPAGRVEATLAGAGGELLESVELFDVYRGESLGEGARSLAFRLRFCRARPHAHRRGDRCAPRHLHHGGRAGPPGRTALSRTDPGDRLTRVPGRLCSEASRGEGSRP